MAVQGTPVGSNLVQGKANRFALGVLTFLFFMWGFITCLNDILIPYLKASFDLSYAQAMMIQFCFFGAYFLVSLPAGALVQRVGYQKGIVSGLVIAGGGCLLFYPAAELGIYAVFLVALFVLASGITVLQVSANPFVTVLGAPETAASRLTMTQAFNALGTTIAPFFGAMLILSGSDTVATTSSPDSVKLPYLLLAGLLLALALLFRFISLPEIKSAEQTKEPVKFAEAFKHKHLMLGALAIFVYVGAEVSIGSFLVNFIAQPHIGAIEEAQAAHYIAYYWGGAMVGRFIGSVVMRKIDAGKVLCFNACIAVVLLVVTVATTGSIAMWAVLAIGLFNSIMFPTIFSLSLHGLGKYAELGSGVLCLAIVGGALVPLLQGVTADLIGIQLAFLLPIVCYLYIAYFGVISRQEKLSVDQQTAVGGQQ